MSQIFRPSDLTHIERETCAKLGVTEEDYRAARDLPAFAWNERCAAESVQLAGRQAQGLSASELETCQAVGITPEAFAAEKVRQKR